MIINIFCLECKKETINYELGEMLFNYDNIFDTLLIKNKIICPKCKKDISNKRIAIKRHEISWKAFTAHICLLSENSCPSHLLGCIGVNSNKYLQIKDIYQTEPLLVEGFNELRKNSYSQRL